MTAFGSRTVPSTVTRAPTHGVSIEFLERVAVCFRIPRTAESLAFTGPTVVTVALNRDQGCDHASPAVPLGGLQ